MYRRPYGLAVLLALATPAASEEVRYFASGWPIALVNAACGDDEWCQTELANCPPGTDGICMAQVAWCNERKGGAESYDGPCTVLLSEPGDSVMRWLPDGSIANYDDTAGVVPDAIRNASTACVVFNKADTFCFEAIVSPSELKRWADGKMSQ